jgi:hypothetical protein
VGANLQIFGFSDKVKTAQQALKNANDRGEQDRYENGHSYSGGVGMLHFRVVNRVFDTVDDFEQCFLGSGPYNDKGDGVIAQVRVIRETKPLVKARQNAQTAEYAVLNATTWRRPTEKAPTAAQLKRLQAKAEKAQTKYKALLAKQVAKSTKTRFIGGGWCAE